MNYKKLSEYTCLADVPLDHPEVLYKCVEPAIMCPYAGGDFGCLAKEDDKCTYKREK